MANANVKTFTEANFDAEVLGSDVPVLVDVWAEWCGPCRMLGPTIDAVADEYAGKVKVGKLDMDENQGLAGRFGIMAIPTMLIFQGGKEVGRMVGLKMKPEISAALDRALQASGGAARR
jgi:thioredoxin 1